MSPVSFRTSAWLDVLEPAGANAAAIAACRSALGTIAAESLFDELCWYPSAGLDVRDVDAMTPAGCCRMGFDHVPRIFVHTDVLFGDEAGLRLLGLNRLEVPEVGDRMEGSPGERTVLERHEVRMSVGDLIRAHADLLLANGEGEVGSEHFPDRFFDSLFSPGSDAGILVRLGPPAFAERRRRLSDRDEAARTFDDGSECWRCECGRAGPPAVDAGERWVLMLGRTNWQFLAVALALRLDVRTIWFGNEGEGFGGCKISLGEAAKWFGALGCRQFLKSDRMCFCVEWANARADRIGARFMRRALPYRLLRCQPSNVHRAMWAQRHGGCFDGAPKSLLRAMDWPWKFVLEPLVGVEPGESDWLAEVRAAFDNGLAL
jgi:hypothetical protein